MMNEHLKTLQLLANAALAAGLIKDIQTAVKVSAAIDAFKDLAKLDPPKQQ